MKKVISILLATLILLSSFSFSTFAYDNGEYPLTVKQAIAEYELLYNVKVETYRNYFYIPETSEDYLGKDNTDIPDWCNEYSNTMYIWWDFTMAENSPVPVDNCGYIMQRLSKNIYYADIPVGVVQFTISNGVEAEEKPEYSACSTPVLGLEAADKYGKFPNHDGEIYVIKQFEREKSSSTAIFTGTWYQYKGGDCFGNLKHSMCLNPKHDHKYVSQAVSEAIKELEAQTGETIETHRYYFLMPNGSNGEKGDDDNKDEDGYQWNPYYDNYAPSWYNEYTNGAGIYWWHTGVADPSLWPGHTMERTNTNSDVYYADVPVDVHTIIFNNNVNGGLDQSSDIYYAENQSINVPCEYYDAGESPNYPEGTESFDNMIFVIDPDGITINELSGKQTWGGEWYYYYGGGCYGFEKYGTKDDCLRDDHHHSLKEAIPDYEKETGEKVETNRYYFLMPNGENGNLGDDDSVDSEGYPSSEYYGKYAPSWYNEYTKSAGIYWWDSGVCDPLAWTGYTMEKGDSDSVFYADVPKAVQTLIFNNNVDGGMDMDLPVYYKSEQSINVPCEYYDVGESPTYPDGVESFDNMIFVIDPDLNFCFIESYPRTPWGGEWYYYYGDGCYGFEKNGDYTNCIRDDHDHSNDIILGDVDGDEEVSIMDATEIQMVLAQIKPEFEDKTIADFDGDGEVSILDATAIQLKLAQIS